MNKIIHIQKQELIKKETVERMKGKIMRWGILGAGNIAHRFAASLQNVENTELYAISGRNMDKLNAFAEQFPCEKKYQGYDLLLADENVDAVYLALPHGMHKEWALKALKAGKAVLCEKPATVNEQEMQEIADISGQERVLFMEAMKSRFEPAYIELKKQIEAGVIGTIERIDTSVCFQIPAEMRGKTYHTMPGQGGALLDSGIYCAGLIEDFLKGEPVNVQTYANYYGGIDWYVDSLLQFDNGQCRIEVGFDRTSPRDAVIYGTEGKIHLPDLHRPSKFIITKNTGEEETVEVPYVHDDFYGQIDHFCQLWRTGRSESPIMTREAMIREAHILDTVRNAFTCYDMDDLKVLEEQEEVLQYPSFTSEDALSLGNRIAQMAKEYDRPVAIRIQDETGLVVFQYMMDGKTEKNEMYMLGKRQCVLDTAHSSAWTYIAGKIDSCYEAWWNDGKHAVSGGAFPIRVNGERKAVVMVSGLHEGKDHELLVRALCAELNVSARVFRKALG